MSTAVVSTAVVSTAVATPERTRRAAGARHEELAASRRRLATGPHAELRAALGLARLSCSAGLTADLEDLTRRAARRLDVRGRAARAETASWLEEELDGIGRRSAERFDATAGPAVRRVAARLCPGAAPLPLPPAGSRAATPGPGSRRVERPDPSPDPRLLAGLAGLPMLAAGGLGLATVLTVVGALLVLAALAHARGEASARARTRAGTARVVAAAGVEAERELARRTIEVERAVGAVLERAVADRRARLDVEIGQVRDALR